MNVSNAVMQRRSIRAYTDEPVPKEKLDRILEAARLAPSARNTQPWHFVVVTDKEKRKILSKGAYAKFLAQSPVVIVALGDKKASSDWYAVDVSLAVENMILTAQEEGLGTCCVGSFDEAEVRQAVGARQLRSNRHVGGRVPEGKTRRRKQAAASNAPAKKPWRSRQPRRIWKTLPSTNRQTLGYGYFFFC